MLIFSEIGGATHYFNDAALGEINIIRKDGYTEICIHPTFFAAGHVYRVDDFTRIEIHNYLKAL
jgi:hypothetical protein